MIYFQIAIFGAVAFLVAPVAIEKFNAMRAATPQAAPQPGNAIAIARPILQGEVVDESPEGKLREALKLITCHIACEVDDPADQTAALNACRTLKRFLPAIPSGRTEATTDNQAALLAAVSAYNERAAEKITAVG